VSIALALASRARPDPSVLRRYIRGEMTRMEQEWGDKLDASARRSARRLTAANLRERDAKSMLAAYYERYPEAP